MLTSHVENYRSHAPYLKSPHLDVNPKVNLNLNLIPKDCEEYASIKTCKVEIRFRD